MSFRFERAAAALALLLAFSLAAGRDPSAPQPQPDSQGNPAPSGQSGSAIPPGFQGSQGLPGARYMPPQAPGGRAARGGPPSPALQPPTDAELRADRQENIKDATALALLSARLKREIEENDSYVLSVDTVRKIDEIEKLVKKIRARLVRH